MSSKRTSSKRSHRKGTVQGCGALTAVCFSLLAACSPVSDAKSLPLGAGDFVGLTREGVISANGPFQLPARDPSRRSKVMDELRFATVNLLPADVYARLEGSTLAWSVAQGSNLAAPVGIGFARYDGGQALRCSNPADCDLRAMAGRVRSLQADELDGMPIWRSHVKLDDEERAVLLVNPAEGVLVVATSAAYVKSSLGLSSSRSRPARAIPEIELVDRSAPFWGARRNVADNRSTGHYWGIPIDDTGWVGLAIQSVSESEAALVYSSTDATAHERMKAALEAGHEQYVHVVLKRRTTDSATMGIKCLPHRDVDLPLVVLSLLGFGVAI